MGRSFRVGNGEPGMGTSTSVLEAGRSPIVKLLTTKDRPALSTLRLPDARFNFVSTLAGGVALATAAGLEAQSGSHRRAFQTPTATRPSKPASTNTSMPR